MSGLNQIRIVPSAAKYAEQMEDLQHAVYGTTRENPYEVFTAARFRHHLSVFPEGQFVALDGDRVVGLTVSMRAPFDPARPHLDKWWASINDGWLTNHDPNGEWMYGVESCVHKDYQGRGVGSKLMDARFNVARQLNLRGMFAGSAIMSYFQVPETVSVEAYVQGVVEGRYFDINLTKQVKKGFRPVGITPNYVVDPESRYYGIIIVWENPDYDPARTPAARVVKRQYRMTMHDPRVAAGV
jgi:GNAT superfamily N-acetyltransferase